MKLWVTCCLFRLQFLAFASQASLNCLGDTSSPSLGHCIVFLPLPYTNHPSCLVLLLWLGAPVKPTAILKQAWEKLGVGRVIELDLGFQQKQSSELQHWALNLKPAQIFFCREWKSLYRAEFSYVPLGRSFLVTWDRLRAPARKHRNLPSWECLEGVPSSSSYSCAAEWFPPANTPLSPKGLLSHLILSLFWLVY